MISGLGFSSSGVATAVRTASKARATMDTMTRQIATGQRVASVKDDGAAWARAVGIRSDQATWDARKGVLDMVAADVEVTATHVDLQRELWLGLRDLVLRARTTQPGTQIRQMLQAEWTETVAAMATSSGSITNFAGATFVTDGWNSGIDLASGDSFLTGGGRWMIKPNLASANFQNAAHPRPVRLFDMLNATAVQLDEVTSTIDTILGDQASGGTFLNLRAQKAGNDLQRARSLQDHADMMIARLDVARGALTDADLGKASTARAQAETRQQLALSTVRQAISTYGNMASGLLGNVQRTQRGVMA